MFYFPAYLRCPYKDPGYVYYDFLNQAWYVSQARQPCYNLAKRSASKLSRYYDAPTTAKQTERKIRKILAEQGKFEYTTSGRNRLRSLYMHGFAFDDDRVYPTVTMVRTDKESRTPLLDIQPRLCNLPAVTTERTWGRIPITITAFQIYYINSQNVTWIWEADRDLMKGQDANLTYVHMEWIYRTGGSPWFGVVQKHYRCPGYPKPVGEMGATTFHWNDNYPFGYPCRVSCTEQPEDKPSPPIELLTGKPLDRLNELIDWIIDIC